MALINEAEERFPVDRWTWNDIHVWPYVRVRLNFDLLRFSQVQGVVPQNDGPVSRVTRHARNAVRGITRQLYAKWQDSGKSDRLRRADVLFLSDGISFVQEEGKWLERFCEPIAEQLRRDNVSTLLLTPLHYYHTPRNAPSVYIQSSLDTALASGLFKARMGLVKTNWSLERYDELSQWLGQRTGGAPLCGRKWLARSMTIVDAITRRFLRLMRQVRPRLVMQVSYYSTIGMACNIACRQFGVPTFDIQHGVQGDLHVAYGRWNKVPETGYAMLPRYFWCWSEYEVESIQRWADAFDQYHQALVGGNPYLTMWRDGSSPVVKESDLRLSHLVHDKRRQILVTLQFGFGTERELGGLLEAIRQTTKAYDWWVRFHPAMTSDERMGAAGLFIEAGLSGERFEVSSKLPLYALLRHMHVHITHSSSTVIEAAQFGIPSIIVNTFGAELFPAYIKSGVACVATQAREIIEALRRLERHTAMNETSRTQGDSAWRMCRQIVPATL